MNDTDNLFGKLEKLHSRGVLSPDNNGSPKIEQRPSQNKQSELTKLGVFDPILNFDTKLFVDPLLLKQS